MNRPWQWRIINQRTERIVAWGVQWTRPWTAVAQIAAERMACYAYRLYGSHREAELAGLVCEVWRAGEPERRGRSYGEEWLPHVPTLEPMLRELARAG
ncbi:MAG TPA: hypothetical protein VGD43_12515 [Micromonospora sp.]